MDVMEAVDGALDNVKNAMDNAIQVNTPVNMKTTQPSSNKSTHLLTYRPVSNLENQPRDPAAETEVGFFMSAEDCSQLAGGEGAEGEL